MSNMRHRDGKTLERSAPEGIEQRPKVRSFDSSSWHAAPTTPQSWPERCLLSMALPRIPRGCLFPSHRLHTQDGTSRAAQPLLHCTTMSGEMKVKTSVFTVSLLSLKEKCFSTDGRELGAGGRLRFKTNPRSQLCRQLRLSPRPFFVQSILKLSFRAGFGRRQNGVGSLRDLVPPQEA